MKGFNILTIICTVSVYLTIINATIITEDFCKKRKIRRHKMLNDFKGIKTRPKDMLQHNIEYLKDVIALIDQEKKDYEEIVGSHAIIITNIGLKDFYPTRRSSKKLKLPRKRKVRVSYEIQWFLRSMVFHLKIASIVEKDYNFGNVEKKIRIAVDMWRSFMSTLGIRSKSDKSCYRREVIPKLSTRREASKHSSIVLRDIQCTMYRLVTILENCRIKKKLNKKKGKKESILSCGRHVRSVFYNNKRKSNQKVSPNACRFPRKMYSLSDL